MNKCLPTQTLRFFSGLSCPEGNECMISWRREVMVFSWIYFIQAFVAIYSGAFKLFVLMKLKTKSKIVKCSETRIKAFILKV